MTLGNIFGSAMSSTTSTYYNRYPSSGTDSHQILSDRDGTGYSYGYKKSKGKYKSDKKHAAMSALTLLAFLFFLNILQNCLREQTQPIASEVTMMMMMPAPQKTIKGGTPNENDRSAEDESNPWNGNIRRSRSLLQYNEEQTEVAKKPVRHMKFIEDYRDFKQGWANGLSQLSEKELENQRIRTDNLQSYLKRYRVPIAGAKRTTMSAIPLIREPGKLSVVRETTPAVPKYETRPKYNLFKSPIGEDDWIPKPGPVYRPIAKTQNVTALGNATGNQTDQDGIINKIGRLESIETRNRRSEAAKTGEQQDDNKIQNEVQTVTPSLGLDLNTYKTYPVYNYNNRRETLSPYGENQTSATTASPEPTSAMDRVSAPPTSTTEHYPSIPMKSPYHRYPMKNRFRYASPNRFYQPRYPIDSRYRYSPYRKNSNYYEPSQGYHVHEEYYPVAVVRNPQTEDEVGFDLIKFVWTMLTGFARPLSKIVPGFAKVGSDEPQCYDLLVCEAHRVSKLMGPTAEAVASTFSTLLTWYTSEENRQPLIEAVTSGKENTCQQQILNCDERSGGKSAMTVLAQVLEMKLR